MISSAVYSPIANNFHANESLNKKENQATSKPSTEKIIDIRFSKLVSDMVSFMYENSALKEVADSFVAITEIEEAEEMVEKLKLISQQIKIVKESGIYPRSVMRTIQDEIVKVERKNFTMSSITRDSVQVSINNLFNSINNYYMLCQANNVLSA